MTNVYWAQFDHSAIEEMHGIDRNAIQEDDLDPYIYMDEEKIDHQDEPLSLESLGMSWRDFI